MRLVVLALTVSLLVAGCGGSPGEQLPEGQHIEGDSVVRGLVTDDELRPLPAVSVVLTTTDQRTFEALSDGDGRFELEDIPAGRHTIEATRTGFEASTQAILLLPGQNKDLRVVLVPLPGGGTYNQTFTFRGKYECAADTPTGSGSCDSTLVGAGGQPVFDEEANHTFNLGSGWGGLLFEANWTTSSDTETIRGVRLKVGSGTDNTTYIQSTHTGRPLRLALNSTELHPNGHPERPIPVEGDRLWITVRPVGQGAEPCSPADPCTGVGGTAEMRYTLWLTTFTGSTVDWGFTAIPHQTQ